MRGLFKSYHIPISNVALYGAVHNPEPNIWKYLMNSDGVSKSSNKLNWCVILNYDSEYVTFSLFGLMTCIIREKGHKLSKI